MSLSEVFMARQRRSFSEEFKREAVKLVDQTGSSKADIARDLGISASLLARWHQEEEASNSPAAKASDAVSAEDYERMRHELAKV
jgi:transposase